MSASVWISNDAACLLLAATSKKWPLICRISAQFMEPKVPRGWVAAHLETLAVFVAGLRAWFILGPRKLEISKILHH
jgi:hypothetical protein